MAANEAVVLSEKDRDYIEEVMREAATRLVNYPPRPLSERQFAEGEDHQGPETYIAIPVEPEGIEGLNHETGNIAGEDDLPGIGECDIFQLVDGKLSWVEKVQQVYNLSEERVRNDAFPVTRTKFGPWIIVNKPVEVCGILERRLDAATGPLTGAKFGWLRLIEWDHSSAIGTGTGTGTGTGSDDDVPDIWKVTKRRLRFVNRSVNFKGAAGTFGSVRKQQGEFHPSVLDCKASEEGIHAIVDIFSDTFGGFVYGG